MTIERIGNKIGHIDVSISYKIIELFSAGLYSSPNKAFEELVCNSYDAFAQHVAVYVPQDISVDGAYIWVCDDGESMNSEELKGLWRIGESDKRISNDGISKRRKQIGRFGIGKLATAIDYAVTITITDDQSKATHDIIITGNGYVRPAGTNATKLYSRTKKKRSHEMRKTTQMILPACMTVSMIACIILSLQRAIYHDQVQNLQTLFGSISILSTAILLSWTMRKKENKINNTEQKRVKAKI